MAGSAPPLFPRLRWVALAFLLIWVPSYAAVWGWRNFLQLCDVAVFLTVLGVWRGSPLLLSSQTTGSLVINALWTADVLANLLTGSHLIGGTEYMWNTAHPLGVRLLSLFHVAMPLVQFHCLRRTGYDRRALAFVAAMAAVVMPLSRVVALPGTNPNFTIRAPWNQTVISPTVHLIGAYAAMLLVLVLPVHLALRRLLPPARTSAPLMGASQAR